MVKKPVFHRNTVKEYITPKNQLLGEANWKLELNISNFFWPRFCRISKEVHTIYQFYLLINSLRIVDIQFDLEFITIEFGNFSSRFVV